MFALNVRADQFPFLVLLLLGFYFGNIIKSIHTLCIHRRTTAPVQSSVRLNQGLTCWNKLQLFNSHGSQEEFSEQSVGTRESLQRHDVQTNKSTNVQKKSSPSM